MIKNGFLTTPVKGTTPYFLISPFSNSALIKNRYLPRSTIFNDYCRKRFTDRDFRITLNGRQAIKIALDNLGIGINDLVTIITTSQNYYVSGCVAKEIEKVCKWNREICNETKVIFLIHEFGYPVDAVDTYTASGLPIIEDCAFSFDSTDQKGLTGRIGNYVIYSFPKYFPVQIGGMIVSKNELPAIILPESVSDHIQNTLSSYISSLEEISNRRLNNYNYYLERTSDIPVVPRLPMYKGINPGVFLFKLNIDCDLQALKNYYLSMGVQCSVFYGESAFFLPVHQNLNESEIDYFITLLEQFLFKEL